MDTNSTFIQDLAKRIEATDSVKLARGTHHTCSGLTQVSINIKAGDLVWVRVDRVRRPLEAPYGGPLQVINASETTVTVQYLSSRTNVVSKERVKIAKATQKDLLSKPFQACFPRLTPSQQSLNHWNPRRLKIHNRSKGGSM